VLVTTHYLDEAEHCNRIAVINAGRLAALGSVDELRRVFDTRSILELRGPEPIALMRALDARPEVEKTTLFGTAVHAVLRSRDTDAQALAGALARDGHPITSMATIEPSLEDVFLDVVEKTA
jgi:ABC-2 type transport system ATP-binding protein